MANAIKINIGHLVHDEYPWDPRAEKYRIEKMSSWLTKDANCSVNTLKAHLTDIEHQAQNMTEKLKDIREKNKQDNRCLITNVPREGKRYS